MKLERYFGPLIVAFLPIIANVEAQFGCIEETKTYTSVLCTRGCSQPATTTTQTVYVATTLPVSCSYPYPTTTSSTVHAPSPTPETKPIITPRPAVINANTPSCDFTTVTSYTLYPCSLCTDYTAIRTWFTTRTTTLNPTYMCPIWATPLPTSTLTPESAFN